jgi:hypothetical protein
MKERPLQEELERIASDADFAQKSLNLTDRWAAEGVGAEAVGAVLRFMECHSQLHYGTPGALVHFVESVCTDAYEDQLIESINRKPTFTTVWMLHRLMNVTQPSEHKQRQYEVLKLASLNPNADSKAKYWIHEFLQGPSQ